MSLLSVSQVAERTGLKTAKVLRAIKKGALKASKVGWNWVISEEDLKTFQSQAS